VLRRRTLLAGAAGIGALVSGCLPSLGGGQPLTKVIVAVPQLSDGFVDPTIDRLKLAGDRLAKAQPSLELEILPIRATSDGYAEAAAEMATAPKNAPDLVVVPHGDVPSLVTRKALVSLDRLTRDDRELALDDYYPGVVEPNRYRGQLYALPYVCAPIVVFYNPAVFAAAGLKPPSTNWTWQEFLQTARALTRDTDGDGQTDQWGTLQLPGIPSSLLYVWQNGGDLVDSSGQVAIDRPEAIEALAFMGEISGPQGPALPPSRIPSSGLENLLLTGKVATFFYHVSLGIYWRGQGFGFELAEPPRGRVRASILTSSAIAVGAKTPNPEKAYVALRRIADELQQFSLVPPRRSLAKDLRKVEGQLTDQDIQVILNTLEYARGPVYENHPAVVAALTRTVDSPLLLGQKDAARAARDGAKAIQAALDGRQQ
jgi:multiple sugar transport system substrate-binding protein